MISLGINNTRPVRDVFTEFYALQGTLMDDQAKATLAEFLFHNPAFLMESFGSAHFLGAATGQPEQRSERTPFLGLK